MIKAIFDMVAGFFSSILHILDIVINLAVSTFTTIAQLLLHLTDFNNLIAGAFNVLPFYAVGIIGITLSIITVYFVLRVIRG